MTDFLILISLLLAHTAPSGWQYPTRCCGLKDCHVADTVNMQPDGSWLVTVGSDKITVPAGYKAERSQDGNYHICYASYANSPTVIYCFFEPGST